MITNRYNKIPATRQSGQTAASDIGQSIVTHVQFQQGSQRAERGRFNPLQRIVGQIQGTKTEQGLKDGVVDLGQIVVRQIDRVELVQFWKRLARHRMDQVVRHVENFQSRHVV